MGIPPPVLFCHRRNKMLQGFIDAETNNVCLGVHYVTDLENASRHFESSGFSGVRDIEIMDGETNLNCNDARTRVVDMGKRFLGQYYFSGSWDYSVGRCAIYRFKFDSYTGPGQSDAKNGYNEYSVFYSGD